MSLLFLFFRLFFIRWLTSQKLYTFAFSSGFNNLILLMHTYNAMQYERQQQQQKQKQAEATKKTLLNDLILINLIRLYWFFE